MLQWQFLLTCYPPGISLGALILVRYCYMAISEISGRCDLKIGEDGWKTKHFHCFPASKLFLLSLKRKWLSEFLKNIFCMFRSWAQSLSYSGKKSKCFSILRHLGQFAPNFVWGWAVLVRI